MSRRLIQLMQGSRLGEEAIQDDFVHERDPLFMLSGQIAKSNYNKEISILQNSNIVLNIEISKENFETFFGDAC